MPAHFTASFAWSFASHSSSRSAVGSPTMSKNRCQDSSKAAWSSNFGRHSAAMARAVSTASIARRVLRRIRNFLLLPLLPPLLVEAALMLGHERGHGHETRGRTVGIGGVLARTGA